MDCVFCKRPSVRLYGQWNSRVLHCSCWAHYPTRFRLAWPLFPRLALSRWEPIKPPSWPRLYYGYIACLRALFSQLRHCSSPESLAGDAREFLPLCDLVRFWDYAAAESYLEQLSGPAAEMLKLAIDQASNPAIEMPKFTSITQFHAICDFASWGLTRLADGQMDPVTTQEFGYFLHNFPEGEDFRCEDEETQAAYARAVAGRLPTARRAEIGSQMRAQLQLAPM